MKPRLNFLARKIAMIFPIIALMLNVASIAGCSKKNQERKPGSAIEATQQAEIPRKKAGDLIKRFNTPKKVQIPQPVPFPEAPPENLGAE